MSEVPIRTNSGDLGCPRCETPLQEGRSPFNLHGEYVGNFNSLVCPICNYSMLTSSGYIEATKEANTQGLVGPEEKIDIPEIGEVFYKFTTNLITKIQTKQLRQQKSVGDDDTRYVGEILEVITPTIVNGLIKNKIILK